MALVIVTWLWGTKYSPDYVTKLAAGARRHLKQPHRFLCITERERDISFAAGIERHAIKDPELIGRGCFVRLRLFEPEWQAKRGVDDRLVCIDLDTVITGPIDPLFDRPEPFVILQGANAKNPCPFNGSLMMLRAGAHSDVWSTFSMTAAIEAPHHEFPDDQGWLWDKIPDAAGWKAGAESGVYAFQKPGWPKGDNLPADARIVAFPGWRDPSKFAHLDWVQQYWRA